MTRLRPDGMTAYLVSGVLLSLAAVPLVLVLSILSAPVLFSRVESGPAFMGPWAVALVGALMSAAGVALLGGLAAVFIVRVLVASQEGAVQVVREFFSCGFSLTRECFRLLERFAALLGAVGALVLMTAPISIGLAADPPVPESRSTGGGMSEVQAIITSQLGFGAALASVGCVYWSAELIWRQLQRVGVPQMLRLVVCLAVPTACFSALLASSNHITEVSLTRWLPEEVDGYSRKKIVAEIAGKQDWSVIPWWVVALFCLGVVSIGLHSRHKAFALP